MSSEPGYFYTARLPEKYGRILERMSAAVAGLVTPEELASRFLRDMLEEADRDYQAELCGNLGDDEDLKAAYRGG